MSISVIVMGPVWNQKCKHRWLYRRNSCHLSRSYGTLWIQKWLTSW